MQICQLTDGKNVIKKGDMVFFEGSNANKVGLILQGSFNVLINQGQEEQNSGFCTLFTIKQSSFIGENDFTLGTHTFSYIANEDSIIYVYPASNILEMRRLIESKKEYNGYLIYSILNLFKETCTIFDKLHSISKTLLSFNEKMGLFFWHISEKYNHSIQGKSEGVIQAAEWFPKIKRIGGDIFFSQLSYDFFEKNAEALYKIKEPKNEVVTKIDYYKKVLELDNATVKSAYACDYVITQYNVQEISQVLADLKDNLYSELDLINESMASIYLEDEDCLYSDFYNLSNKLKSMGDDNGAVIECMKYMKQKIFNTVEIENTILSAEFTFNMDSMEEIYEKAITFEPTTEEDEEDDITSLLDETVEISENGIPLELENSLEKIVAYSGVEEELANKFVENMNKFVEFRDKTSLEPEVREVKKYIEANFFIIYEKVFKRVCEERNKERIYDMFLNYSYMDERLLLREDLIKLYCVKDIKPETKNSNIYTMKEWLEAIYYGEREPSLNEFDMDYFDTFRDLKKQRILTDKDKKAYDNDKDGKLTFEIKNFFAKNQRLCCGQASLYFPVLYSDLVVGSFDRTYVSSERITRGFERILDIDFSLFYREIFCHDEERGLEKEYIMKEVLPDVILMPTFGLKSVMWQPIAGRDRSKPARFAMPIFTIENLDNMMVRMAGIYRWELCKTVMGISWADITQKSLTSEFADYIQFYRKNSDLSNEAKEKVKNLITRSRNMLKEVFASEYETWVKYESTGAVRLNKVVRSILYIYCPFSRALRTKIEMQAAFFEAANAYSRNRNKKVKEIENKIARLAKTTTGVPEELNQNLVFYRDL